MCVCVHADTLAYVSTQQGSLYIFRANFHNPNPVALNLFRLKAALNRPLNRPLNRLKALCGKGHLLNLHSFFDDRKIIEQITC